jgi:hypothetical protein
MEIDQEGMDIQISDAPEGENGRNVPVLCANIAIKNMRNVPS